jgi:hypothetical protein
LKATTSEQLASIVVTTGRAFLCRKTPEQCEQIWKKFRPLGHCLLWLVFLMTKIAQI